MPRRTDMTQSETRTAITNNSESRSAATLGGSASSALDRRDLPILCKLAITLIVLTACLVALFDRNLPPDYSKWAFGMIGVVMGYWLK